MKHFNMSGLTALQLLLDNSNAVNQLKHLRSRDPSLVHLDWESAEKWIDVISPAGSSLKFICRSACDFFIRHDRVLMKLATYGRERLISILNEDERQVFRNADLLESIPSDDVVEWWDNLKATSRGDLERSLIEQGRLAEKWTIDIEVELLRSISCSRELRWVALDGDHYGYDVLSYRKRADDNFFAVLIEVKSFSKMNSPHIYLSINEWKKALQAEENFFFYVWCVENKDYRILSAKDIVSNIPEDRGLGVWQNVLIDVTPWWH